MILLTNQTRNESTTERYSDMMMQNTITTVVDPSVSLFVGNVIFRNSLLTSRKNSIVESHNFLNIERSVQPVSYKTDSLILAGALGIEPRPSVLETDVLAVKHHAPTTG